MKNSEAWRREPPNSSARRKSFPPITTPTPCRPSISRAPAVFRVNLFHCCWFLGSFMHISELAICFSKIGIGESLRWVWFWGFLYCLMLFDRVGLLLEWWVFLGLNVACMWIWCSTVYWKFGKYLIDLLICVLGSLYYGVFICWPER